MAAPTRAEATHGLLVRAIERTLLVGLVLVGVLLLFRRTRRVAGALGVLWLAAAWPAAALWRTLGGPDPAGGRVLG